MIFEPPTNVYAAAPAGSPDMQTPPMRRLLHGLPNFRAIMSTTVQLASPAQFNANARERERYPITRRDAGASAAGSATACTCGANSPSRFEAINAASAVTASGGLISLTEPESFLRHRLKVLTARPCSRQNRRAPIPLAFQVVTISPRNASPCVGVVCPSQLQP